MLCDQSIKKELAQQQQAQSCKASTRQACQASRPCCRHGSDLLGHSLSNHLLPNWGLLQPYAQAAQRASQAANHGRAGAVKGRQFQMRQVLQGLPAVACMCTAIQQLQL